MMNNYAAIIVSYNPDIDLLRRNVEAISKQLDKVIIYDNASKNQAEVFNTFNNKGNVTVIRSSQNNGISKAVNDSVKRLDSSVEWFLTLDQDSVSPDNLIEEYSKFTNLDGVKMISPRVQLEVGREIQQQSTTEPFEYINRCITSACFVEKKAFYEIGGLDEQMFIDWVDHDICKHFEIKGFKMVQSNKVVLYHNLGSSKPVKGSLWFNKIFGTKVIYQTYSPFRIYYMIRNTIYYMRKYKGYLNKGEKRSGWKLIFQHVALKSIVTGEHKWTIAKAIVRGVKEGYKLPVNIETKYI